MKVEWVKGFAEVSVDLLKNRYSIYKNRKYKVWFAILLYFSCVIYFKLLFLQEK